MQDNKYYTPLCGHYNKSLGWVRLFGYGFLWKNTSVHGLIFSERNGNKKYIRIGRYIFRALNPKNY